MYAKRLLESNEIKVKITKIGLASAFIDSMEFVKALPKLLKENETKLKDGTISKEQIKEI